MSDQRIPGFEGVSWMETNDLVTLKQVKEFTVSPERRFLSATHEKNASGATTDIYWVRTYEILKKLNLEKPKLKLKFLPGGKVF